MIRIISLFILGLVLSSAAFGQSSTATSTTTVNIENRVITLTNTAGLNFGTVMPFSTAGTLRVNANSTFTPSDLHVSDSSNLRASSWQVAGVPNAPFAITLPTEITITNGADSMTVTDFVHNGSSVPRLNSNGADAFGVGATLNVAGGQTPGTYTGTFDVTVNYP